MSYWCQVWSKHCCTQLKYWSGLFDSLQFISIHIVWIGICSNRPLAPLSVRGHKFDFWLLDRKFNGSKPVQCWINTETFCLFTHCILHRFWVGTRMITNKTTIQLQCILSFDNILTTPFKIPAYLCPAFSPPVPSANARSLKRWSLAIATQANVWPFWERVLRLRCFCFARVVHLYAFVWCEKIVLLSHIHIYLIYCMFYITSVLFSPFSGEYHAK